VGVKFDRIQCVKWRIAIRQQKTQSRRSFATQWTVRTANIRPSKFGTFKMWHLIEDFFDQGLVMKALIGVGWLAVLIMIFSLGQQLLSS